MKKNKNTPEGGECEVFKLLFQEEKGYFAEFRNTDDVVMGLADFITEHLQLRDQEPLSVLFSVVIHVLARETSGRFEEQFIENVRKSTVEYRRHYAEALSKAPELAALANMMAPNAKNLS